jgi:hypothetical protein
VAIDSSASFSPECDSIDHENCVPISYVQRVSNTCLEVGLRLEARDPAEMTIAGKFYDVRGMMAAI